MHCQLPCIAKHVLYSCLRTLKYRTLAHLSFTNTIQTLRILRPLCHPAPGTAAATRPCSQITLGRLVIIGRAALVAQRPIVIKLSRERAVGRSVCPVHCGKTANRIRMPFGIIGRTGPGMGHVLWGSVYGKEYFGGGRIWGAPL